MVRHAHCGDALGLAAAVFLIGTRRATAQTAMVFANAPGDTLTLTCPRLPLMDDDALRALVAANLADSLRIHLDANVITIVVDAHDRFVRGTLRRLDVRATTSPVTSEGAHAYVSVSATTEFGSAIHDRGAEAPDDVAAFGIKRFAAGELAACEMTVAVIKLK